MPYYSRRILKYYFNILKFSTWRSKSFASAWAVCVCDGVVVSRALLFRPVTSSNVSQPPRRIIDNESAINSKKRMSTKPPNYSFQFPFFCNTKSFFLLLCRTDFYNRYKTKQEMMIFQVSFFMFLFYIFVGGKKNIQTNIFIAVSCAVVVL